MMGVWEALPVSGKQKCMAPFGSAAPSSCANVPIVVSLLDSSGVCDQCWRPEVNEEKEAMQLSAQKTIKPSLFVL